MNTLQPSQNSIVNEIHDTRQRLAELYHNDLLTYSQAAQEHCLALGFNLVDSPRLRHSTEIIKKAIKA
ncbi:hypothetical protein [Methylocucumis oryzae]|uniref:Uncharacterized protein n=1 Tax=Methylocucumis oryzae TaxID=1632867 RepID=A0A0F3IIF9_9GAMM|nr:hypothetical protein [Methylocucumis oryzae]KJV06555.1 hypothetical protein VZ94_10500 [Methylocucumis oryzae]